MTAARILTPEPNRAEAPHSAGQAIATESVPRTRPRGIRTPRREEWEIPAIIPEDLAVLAAIGVGAIILDVSDAVVRWWFA
jgi:hypothetical protein